MNIREAKSDLKIWFRTWSDSDVIVSYTYRYQVHPIVTIWLSNVFALKSHIVTPPHSDLCNLYHVSMSVRRGGNRGPALFNHAVCSEVTSPGVGNNGVILLSVAASLTDMFFFGSSVSFLTELAQCCMFSHLSFEHTLAQFTSQWWTHAVIFKEYPNCIDALSQWKQQLCTCW